MIDRDAAGGRRHVAAMARHWPTGGGGFRRWAPAGEDRPLHADRPDCQPPAGRLAVACPCSGRLRAV